MIYFGIEERFYVWIRRLVSCTTGTLFYVANVVSSVPSAALTCDRMCNVHYLLEVVLVSSRRRTFLAPL